MEDEYIYFSEDSGNKIIDTCKAELNGRIYIDAKSEKTFLIEDILLMPANPIERDMVWGMMIDFYNGGKTTIEEIEKYMLSLNVNEYAVSMISKEQSSNPHPEFRITHFQYVVDDNGELAMGFGIVLK